MSAELNRRKLLGLVIGSAGLTALSACTVRLEPNGPTTSPGAASSVDTATATHAVSEVSAPGQVPPKWPLDDPNALTVLVNKHRPLNPATFRPDNLVTLPLPTSSGNREMLRAPAVDALVKLAAAAERNRTPFIVLSAFRSYETQVSTYNSWVTTLGKSNADAASARPGFSEHQTGLAVDIGDNGACNLRGCFTDQPAGLWVRDNCHEFGFVVRYQPGMQSISGYEAEPWHLRFLGVDLATDVKNSGKTTLEEYFGLAAAPDYL